MVMSKSNKNLTTEAFGKLLDKNTEYEILITNDIKIDNRNIKLVIQGDILLLSDSMI